MNQMNNIKLGSMWTSIDVIIAVKVTTLFNLSV